MTRRHMRCHGGPSHAQIVEAESSAAQVRVQSLALPELTGVYVIAHGSEGPKLVFDDEVFFTIAGREYHVKRAGGDVWSSAPGASAPDAPAEPPRWFVRSAGAHAIADPLREDDFATDGDFTDRMMRRLPP